jgi:hypothetical protein
MPKPVAVPSTPSLGRCLGCAASLDERDEVCARCGLPVATSSQLDLHVLGGGIGRDPIRNGRYTLSRLRAGLSVTDDGVVLRGRRRERRIAWHDISRFDVGEVYEWAANPTSMLVILMRDGARVKVSGVSAEGLVWNKDKQRARVALHAAALNRRLIAARRDTVEHARTG